MKSIVLLCFLFVTLACASESAPASLAGAYRYDGTTQLIELALLPNGNYLAHWSLDISPDNGSASGTWRIEGEEVRLDPKKEDGALKGHLRILLVRTMEGRKALLRREDLKFEKNPFFYFYRKEEPNQSLEPTPPAGTSAAEQPLVPAAVVAHL